MKDWFEELEPRERLFVSVGAIVVVIAVFWGLVWMPLDKGHRGAQERVAVWEQSLAELRPLASQPQPAAGAQGRPRPASTQSPVVIVDTTLRNRSLGQPKRSQPTPNGIRRLEQSIRHECASGQPVCRGAVRSGTHQRNTDNRTYALTPSLKSLITIGLLTFVAGIILMFPARVAYQWFAPDSVDLGGIRGSVWNGSARELNAGGLYLRDVEWQVRPLRLLTGKLAVDVEATPGSGFVEGRVALGFGGDISIADLNGSGSLQSFAGILNMPGLRGDVSLQFERLQLRDGLPVAAVGTIAVAGLVAPLIDPGSIGGYRMELFTNETGVIASVEDTNATFDLAGSLTVSADRNYVFLGKVAATERTSDKLRNQLRFLGSPDPRGRHEIRLEGSL
jgi:general secretion pathway protein N